MSGRSVRIGYTQSGNAVQEVDFLHLTKIAEENESPQTGGCELAREDAGAGITSPLISNNFQLGQT